MVLADIDVPDSDGLVIVTKIGCKPLALSPSKGHSWFDKLTTNGVQNVSVPTTAFSSSVVPVATDMEKLFLLHTHTVATTDIQ